MAEISLYLHIPFCNAKCDYCDFYSVSLRRQGSRENCPDAPVHRYIDVLLKETERRFDELRREAGPVVVPALYIGGGTPSLLGASGVGRLLDGLLPLVGRGCREITVEANPESAGAAFLRACADRGVNRLSLGVQSFSEPARRAAGRQGALVPENLKAASEIFGPGLSLDLMTGLPCQSAADVRAGIDRAVSLGPGHVSLYSLTVEEGTPLAGRLGQAGLPSAGDADRLWLAGRDALIRAGYEQYEVSNFALPGKRCAHNIRYWRMKDWAGIGCAASGTIVDGPGREPADIRGRRSGYAPDVEAFLAGPASCLLVEELDRLTLIKESILMGFRYTEGPCPELFRRRFGLGVEEAVPHTLEKWRAGPRGIPCGETLVQPGKTALSARGLLFLNRFLLDCFEELDRHSARC
ncbi:MAG: coproporphyrinogen III oxidase family protein [Treponema sp.]|nr:coproporphyrinogen III oxidase family protein [Treponema sp.]